MPLYGINVAEVNFKDESTLEGLTPYQREEAKWEVRKSRGGLKPDGYEPYPAMLYKARLDKGRAVCDDDRDCQRIVKDESEDRIARGQGYVSGGPQAAIDALLKEQETVADLAGNRAWHDRKMSEKAQTEAAAAVEATGHHLAEIPEQPRRGPGRPRKVDPIE